jgi:hypothetical protein
MQELIHVARTVEKWGTATARALREFDSRTTRSLDKFNAGWPQNVLEFLADSLGRLKTSLLIPK